MTLLSPPKPLKIKLGKGSKKNLHNSEIWDERTFSKSKPQIALIMDKPNPSEEVNPSNMLVVMNLKGKSNS